MQTVTTLRLALRGPPSARCAPRRFSWRWPRTPATPRPTRRGYATSSADEPPPEKPRVTFEDKYKNKSVVGVFTPVSALLFVGVGAALYFYFDWEKQRLQKQREEERLSRSYGRPTVGGPFELTTHDGRPFSDKDLLGKWSLIYFGFTNCPDICPEELDKMTEAVDILDKEFGPLVQPIFITVDPARDTPAQLARYVADFHPRMVGLRGDYAASKAVCRAYRVYFSTPPGTQPGDDYLVDHSIYFYFMDPDGKFVDAFGKASAVPDVVERVRKEFAAWKEERGGLT
ncbi:SCO1/SenC-domain-containing protein [Vararia minispora EC-137]|uniref:SCO1/SenC-domain-containing protein n=1 Tax=Vararia minispora EC-137 TaxID=1314806 RepID=A0ACB8QCP4_9AGAM|nr:SCO1/SenC-domain-containing protein [Vararia minispora EC-137]